MNGQTFGKYQLLKKLATGGMAEVWLARHTGIEGFSRLLVVKRILPHLADDPEFVQMFLNEAKIAARFNHPNIAQIYDLGETNGTYFIAMEFVHGEDLGRLMRKAWSTGQWIARPLAIRIVASACEGLFYAHTKTDDRGSPLRVVHRDISPQNILVSFDGSVKLVDFGIAKAADAQSMTRSGAIKGKFAYMAPEQAAGKPLDHRSDIFAIGLVLYELLTGVRPLKRDSELATLQAALECDIEPPSRVADVPPELDPVVMSALAKAADDRYRDARTFQMALEEFLVSQRWVATSVQVSELMAALFHDRLEEEARLGYPDPEVDDASSPSGAPASVTAPAGGQAAPTDAGQGKGTQPGEMTWDAPPARPAETSRPPRTLARPRESGEQRKVSPAPPPDVPSWDAPPAADIPGQRRHTGETRAAEPSVVRRPTGDRPLRNTGRSNPGISGAPEQTQEAPPRRTRSSVNAVRASGPRPSGAGVRRRTGEIPPPEAQLPDDTDASVEALPRSKSGQFSLGSPRRISQAGEMPEAPAPKKREASGPKKRVTGGVLGSDISLDDVVDPGRTLKRVKAGALAGLVLVLGATGWVWRADIAEVLTSRPADDIYISASSNLQLEVFVEHAPHENRPEKTYLGRTPLKRKAGAHVRDTLIFENKARGALQRVELTYGQPGDHRQLNLEINTGFFEPRFQPKDLRNLELYLNGEQVGTYPGPKLELVEGQHVLEVRGPQLQSAAQITVEVKAGQNNSRLFNLSSLLNP